MSLVGSAVNAGSIKGTVQAGGSVRGSIASRGTVIGTVQRPLILSAGDGDVYNGPYVVDPTFDDQTLTTKNKTLYNDVTVKSIRVERMSNEHGTTVYIGVKGD